MISDEVIEAARLSRLAAEAYRKSMDAEINMTGGKVGNPVPRSTGLRQRRAARKLWRRVHAELTAFLAAVEP